MATAIHIKSESGDDYLYCLETTVTEEGALFLAERLCPEVRECWENWQVVTTEVQ